MRNLKLILIGACVSFSSIAFSSVVERTKYECSGTEPFFNLEVKNKTIKFTFDTTETYTQTSKSSFVGYTANFAKAITGFRKDANDNIEEISVSILNQSCSDGMSEYIWSHQAVIQKGDQFLFACCGTGNMFSGDK